MSLARALTNLNKRSSEKFEQLHRSNSHSTMPINRAKISAPVALLSTTNSLAYNAPDIKTLRKKPSVALSSSSSDNDSDHTSGSSTKDHTDASSVESSPIVKPNHLSIYFQHADFERKDAPPLPTASAIRKKKSFGSISSSARSSSSSRSSSVTRSSSGARSSSSTRASSIASATLSMAVPPLPPAKTEKIVEEKEKEKAAEEEEKEMLIEALDLVPEIPKRATSHSKKAHEYVANARQRASRESNSQSPEPAATPLTNKDASPAPPPIPAQSAQRHSKDNASQIDKDHPFGRELEQLNEIVEDFGTAIRDYARDEENKYMNEKGLLTFCAAEYLREIQPLFFSFQATPPPIVQGSWI